MNNKSPVVEGLVKQYRTYNSLLGRADSLVSQERLEDADLEKLREISRELRKDSFSPKLLKGKKRERMERVLKKSEELELKKSKELGIEADLKVEANINLTDYIRIPGKNILIKKKEIHRGKKWNETIHELGKEGLFMPPPRLFMDYFLKVIEANEGKIVLYDGANKEISGTEAENLYKYLTSNHEDGCWTWLDAKFVKGFGYSGLDLETDHRFVNKKITSRKMPLEACLMDNCYVDLEFNLSGLPVRKSRKQEYLDGRNIYFHYPIKNSVIRFFVHSTGAYLSCNGNPQDSSASLAVFACCEGTENNLGNK